MKTSDGMKTLGECGVEMIGGQIMNHISAREDSAGVAETRRVVMPRCIGTDGTINAAELPEEALRAAPDSKRLTRVGDIVIKLSTPYDAGRVDEDNAGCLVPSFCAIIRPGEVLDAAYLLAFLNSAPSKEQLRVLTADATLAMLSVGKIRRVQIPVLPMEVQARMAHGFRKLSAGWPSSGRLSSWSRRRTTHTSGSW